MVRLPLKYKLVIEMVQYAEGLHVKYTMMTKSCKTLNNCCLSDTIKVRIKDTVILNIEQKRFVRLIVPNLMYKSFLPAAFLALDSSQLFALLFRSQVWGNIHITLSTWS